MSPARRPLVALAAAALLVSQGACVKRGGKPSAAGEQVLTVLVRNDNIADHAVYLQVGQERQRLGYVQPNTTFRTYVPGNRIAAGQVVQIVANPIGSRVVASSGPLNVGPGSTIDFRIGVQPGQSQVYIR